MKKTLLLLTFLFCTGFFAHADRYSSLWHPVAGQVPSKGEMALHPTKFLGFSASEATLSTLVSNASADPANASIIDLPQPDGTYRSFRIWKNDLLPDALAAKYPGIYTLTAEALDNRSVTAKIDYSQFGFHALVFDGARSYLIDPYSTAADGYYIAYYRSDYTRPAGNVMTCGVNSADDKNEARIDLTPDGLPNLQYRVNGVTRKKYRLALSADSEYCAAVAGPTPTKAAVLAKMVVSVNRVVGVYERELAITMQLVPNDDTLIFLGTDPFSNASGSQMLGQNQTVVTARIGAANYDIGHVFSTGGGGIASLGSVCRGNTKGQGVTGSSSPVGDSYDIDYVAHEMGHQFGGEHTFNANTGSCAGNGVNQSAYEPGSGSTIMAYAGICGSGNDYQQHSDAYFHTKSLEEITSYLATSTGASCGTLSVSTNLNAVVPAFTTSYSIPYKTPFELTAPTAVDATADTLTYCWEQRNLGDFGSAITATHFQGPIFRSFPPVTSPTRTFPILAHLLSNSNYYDAERLPDTARYLTFKMAERDIYQGFGCFNFPDDSIHLDVINTGIPFAVTSPNTSFFAWIGKTTQTITWDVAGTTAAPINAATVNILLSIDGGNTYAYTLATGVPNNGTASITVPNITTTQARIKVKAAGNVFFDISNANFSITKDPTSVGTVPAAQWATVSPNPARNILQITLNGKSLTLNAQLVNTLGQAVLNTVVNGAQNLDVSGLARGMYYLQLTNTATGEKATAQKIVLE